MIILFQKTPDTFPEPVDSTNKRQMLLTDMEAKCFIKKNRLKNSTIEKTRLNKEAHKKEHYVKENLQKSHQKYEQMEIQNHYSKKSLCVKKYFCTSFHKFFIKDKYLKKYWVGHLVIKPLDVDVCFNRRVIISAFGYSLNDSQ